MKKTLIILSIVGLLSSCLPTETESNLKQIKAVETGLGGSVYIRGDSTWKIEDRMSKYGVPGVSIAVIKDNKIAWLKSYGVMDKETRMPVTSRTLFQAGSISKPVAAYGALHVVEHGMIDLDQDVNTYLKSWKLPENEFTAEKKVTLKHLLSHTGGITVHGFLGYSPDLPVPSLPQVLDGIAPANSPPIRVDKVPGKSFRYSGGGYCIMQQMLIDTQVKPFPDIMKELVLDPIGMSHSTYDQPLTGGQLDLAATGYLPDGTMTRGKHHTYPEMAAAGLWTTAEDLAKFIIDIQLTAQGKSNAALSTPMVNKMLTPFVSDFEGLGIFLEKRKDDFYFGHGGWDEGFSSEMKAHRDKGYGVVVLTNGNHPEFISEVINSVARNYNWSNYGFIYDKVPMDKTKFSGITGRYQNASDGVIRVFNEGDRLFLKYLRGKDPFELFQITDSTYISHDDYHPVHPIQFKVDPSDGKLNLVFVEEDKSPSFSHAAMTETEKVPYENLLAGDFPQALKGYQLLIKVNPKDPAIDEDNLNYQGYAFLNAGKNQLAKDIFKINTILYPGSANVYDSYAEACMKSGDKDLAIANYKKSLSLNPDNKNATRMLEELK